MVMMMMMMMMMMIELIFKTKHQFNTSLYHNYHNDVDNDDSRQ